MGFDRSKFKATKIGSIKEVQANAKKNEKFFGGSGGMVYHKIKDGENIHRIAPPHTEKGIPYEPYYSTMLECEVDEYENGEKTGKKIFKKKQIFIATQHAPKDKEGNSIIKADPVLSYIDFVYKKANEEFGQDFASKKKYLGPITGYRQNGWVQGIKPSMNYIAYSWDSNEVLGQITLYNTWMKDMEKLSIQSSDDDEVLILDMFSCPNEGYPLSIDKAKTKDNKGVEKTEYSIGFDNIKKGESWEDFFKRVRISDEKLMELEKLDSLKDRFRGVYTERDFDLAVDGLKRFDEKEGYGIFDNDDFLDKLQEISDQCPKYEPKNNETKDIEKTFDEHEKKNSEGGISPIQMKKIVKDYIDENYKGHFLPSYVKGDTLKEWYVLVLNEDELPFKKEDMPFEADNKDEEDVSLINKESLSPSEAIKIKIAEAKAKRDQNK